MPHQPGSGCLIICADPILPHIIQHSFHDGLIFHRPQQAIGIGDDAVGPPCVEPCHHIPLPVPAHGILGLVPVAEGLLHPHDGLHPPVDLLRRKAPDADQAVSYLVLLIVQLLLIGEGLELASAALSVAVAFRLHAKRRRLHDLLQPRIGIILFALYDPRLHPVAHHGILDEQRKAVHLPYAEAIASHVLNRHHSEFVFLKFHTFSRYILYCSTSIPVSRILPDSPFSPRYTA